MTMRSYIIDGSVIHLPLSPDNYTGLSSSEVMLRIGGTTRQSTRVITELVNSDWHISNTVGVLRRSRIPGILKQFRARKNSTSEVLLFTKRRPTNTSPRGSRMYWAITRVPPPPPTPSWEPFTGE